MLKKIQEVAKTITMRKRIKVSATFPSYIDDEEYVKLRNEYFAELRRKQNIEKAYNLVHDKDEVDLMIKRLEATELKLKILFNKLKSFNPTA